MHRFYFTFGDGQLLENCYTIIEAETYNSAREEMFKVHGSTWAFQYTEAEFLNSPLLKDYKEI